MKPVRSLIAALLLTPLLATQAFAQRTPESVTASEVSQLQDSIEQGCIRRGTDKNDPADAVQKRCACASSVLRTRLTEQEWKTAVAAAFNGDRETATNIIAKHKDEVTVCHAK